MKRTDLFVAEHTTPSFIPARDDCPDQAVLGINLDLLQAVLPAVLAFRPARTFFQVQCWLGKKGSNSGFSYSHLNGFGLVSLRAGNETLFPEIEIRTEAGNGAKYEQPNRQCDYGKNDQGCNGHRKPPDRHSLVVASVGAGPPCRNFCWLQFD